MEPRGEIVMYVCADEALSKSKEIRKAYKEEKPNCGRERERDRAMQD